MRSEVGRWGMLKRDRPSLVIGVAGCMAQQEGERLAKRMPQIDFMLGPDNIGELPSILAQVELGRAAADPHRVRFGRAAVLERASGAGAHQRPRRS